MEAQMSLLDTIREEGARPHPSISHKIGFKYAISNLGTFEDFKNGHITIRLKRRGGEDKYFSELDHCNLSEIKEIFKASRSRAWRAAHGGLNPSHDDLEPDFNAFKTGAFPIKLPTQPGGKITYTELAAEGKSDTEIEKLFHERRRGASEASLKEGSLRYDIYKEFMKLVTNWKPEYYASEKAAEKFPHYIEMHSNKPRPSTRTSFCCLVGRMMTLVRRCHQREMREGRAILKMEQKKHQQHAWDKQSAKREILKQKMGTAAFNAKKHRDKEASAVRKAKEIADKPVRIQRFLEFRKTPRGRAYDNTMRPAILKHPQYDNVRANAPTKHLGHTSRVVFADFIRKNIHTLSNMKIQFDVDPCDTRSVLFQHVAIAGEGVLNLSNTNDFDTKSNFGVRKTFSITAWYTHGSDVYINLDNRRVRCHRKLPKEWAAFERWSGYGIQGNPQVPVSVPTLIKITPYNIATFCFSKNGDKYMIGHTSVAAMQKTLNDLKIKDKYEAAAEKAAAAAAAAKAAQAARKKYKIMKFPTMNEASNANLKKMLAQQLAEGTIDMEAFKMGMAALG